MRVALHLSEVPEARILDAFPSFVWRLLLRRVVPPVRAFHEDSRFESYWQQHVARLQEWNACADAALSAVPVVPTVEQFFGSGPAAYTLAFAPLMDGLRTTDLWASDTGRRATVIFGPRAGVRPDASVDPRTLIVDIALAQFSRLWIADMLDRDPAIVRRHAGLYARATRRGAGRDTARRQHSFWIDNLTAAAHARLAAHAYGAGAGPETLAQSHADDVLACDIYSILDAYEADRARYRTLESFLPALFATLESRVAGEP
jgi:hypothetical protein